MKRINNVVSSSCSYISMTIHSQRIEKCRHGGDVWKNLMLQALFLDQSDVFVIEIAEEAPEEHKNMALLHKRTRHVQNTILNINDYPDHERLLHFRLKRNDIGTISNRMAWEGVSESNQYRCEAITSTSVLTERLGNTNRWYHMEKNIREVHILNA